MLNTQALALMGLDEIISYYKPMTPPGYGQFGPRGMVVRIYEADYHTKYRSSGPCGFREEDFFPL